MVGEQLTLIPKPTEEPMPGRKWVYVPPHERNGVMTEPMWRQAHIRHKKKKKNTKPQKRGPKPGVPRMTNAAHAQYVYDKLETPLAFLFGLQVANNWPHDHDLARSLRASLEAVQLARTFIDRFTTPEEG